MNTDKPQPMLTKAPYVFARIEPAKASPAFDTYWRFATERQSIFFHRLSGHKQPWTSDPILLTYKFTNAYRASDRVSQFLIRDVIYRNDLPNTVDEIFFRIMLFKLFNKIETWQMLEREFGPITWEDYSRTSFNNLLTNAKSNGRTIYSAAYIMPPGTKAFGHASKHMNHLELLELMMAQRVPDRLAQLPRMQDGFELIKSFPTMGDFLAYQFITDINYSEITNFSEMDFVVPGPGAKDGIRKCFTDTGGLSEAELIRFMADRQEIEFERLGLSFQDLWGRRLQLIDCQNLFCEIDKYSRVAHPNIAGISGRTRIKQKFRCSGIIEAPFYPPKWRLNSEQGLHHTESALEL
ncbi:nucleotide kinase domain-containing protein [Ponticaulis koreensis]|uniref:nucleotide kinase domain-containing protein n=1 Tax=Ponticaulis koreensis TaxID=1123045 RepID=UPI000688DEA3